jgi:4-diphosphocytidyl-2-C-methyl-D-erythritol kinase
VNAVLWPAPAKLNLFLHITNRRPDGYHELQTVFQFVDYCDWLGFEINDSGHVSRQGGDPSIEASQDLVVRAALALQQYSGTARGVTISLEKRLPMGAGLGGGSSDAATTLVALNNLWGLNLDQQTLCSIGLKLGADVPIFVHGRAAWAEGVGEKFQPVELQEPWFLVVQPTCSISTAEVFNAAELTRNTPPITIRGFLAGEGRNDCEPVVRKRYAEVGQLIDWLGKKANARMTGTGSCVFSQFESEAEARALLAELPARWSGFVAKGLNHSPLLGMS